MRGEPLSSAERVLNPSTQTSPGWLSSSEVFGAPSEVRGILHLTSPPTRQSSPERLTKSQPRFYDTLGDPCKEVSGNHECWQAVMAADHS